ILQWCLLGVSASTELAYLVGPCWQNALRSIIRYCRRIVILFASLVEKLPRYVVLQFILLVFWAELNSDHHISIGDRGVQLMRGTSMLSWESELSLTQKRVQFGQVGNKDSIPIRVCYELIGLTGPLRERARKKEAQTLTLRKYDSNRWILSVYKWLVPIVSLRAAWHARDNFGYRVNHLNLMVFKSFFVNIDDILLDLGKRITYFCSQQTRGLPLKSYGYETREYGFHRFAIFTFQVIFREAIKVKVTQCTGEAREATAIRIIDSDPEDAKLTIALRFVLTDHLTSGDLFENYDVLSGLIEFDNAVSRGWGGTGCLPRASCCCLLPWWMSTTYVRAMNDPMGGLTLTLDNWVDRIVDFCSAARNICGGRIC
ncbi:unnamed protein product, partial [Nesidiocoris tenuis]